MSDYIVQVEGNALRWIEDVIFICFRVPKQGSQIEWSVSSCKQWLCTKTLIRVYTFQMISVLHKHSLCSTFYLLSVLKKLEKMAKGELLLSIRFPMVGPKLGLGTTRGSTGGAGGLVTTPIKKGNRELSKMSH